MGVDERDEPLRFGTLEDARRIARELAASNPAAHELVVRDAYHRVIRRERV